MTLRVIARNPTIHSANTWVAKGKARLTADPHLSDADRETIATVLNFWFSDVGEDGDCPSWWRPNETFDAACRETLGALSAAALAGHLDGWAATAEGALALVLLLDQAPRNTHRGTPAAFAGDAWARQVASVAVANGLDAELTSSGRLFLYLPFEHSEDLADQERALALIGALGNDQWTHYARLHRDIIARFGRFPHRNAILDRTSTPEERAFLELPDSSF